MSWSLRFPSGWICSSDGQSRAVASLVMSLLSQGSPIAFSCLLSPGHAVHPCAGRSCSAPCSAPASCSLPWERYQGGEPGTATCLLGCPCGVWGQGCLFLGPNVMVCPSVRTWCIEGGSVAMESSGAFPPKRLCPPCSCTAQHEVREVLGYFFLSLCTHVAAVLRQISWWRFLWSAELASCNCLAFGGVG